MKKESIKQHYTIPIPIYNCSVDVILCVDIVEACIELEINKKAIKQFENLSLEGLAIADSNDPTKYVILFRDDIKLGTIVHEVDHTVGQIMLARNTPYTYDTMEVYAYFKEFLFNNIYNRFKAFIKNNNKYTEEYSGKQIEELLNAHENKWK